MAEKITGDDIIKSAVPEVADKLTQGWNYISPGKEVPARAEMEKMAKHLLTTKKLVVDGKEVLDVTELSEEEKKTISKQGLDIKGLELIADKGKREKFAAAVDEGVQSQDTFWNKIMNFLSGLMSWMMSGFKGGFGGLWEHVGAVSAHGVKNAVNESVDVAMKNDPSLKPFAPYMGMVNSAIDEKVMEVATGKTAQERGMKPRAAVKPLAGDSAEIKKEVEGAVKGSIQTAMDNKDLNAKLGSLLTGEKVEVRKREVKEQLGSFVEKAAIDPGLKLGDKPTAEMTTAEFKAALRDNLVQQYNDMQVTNDKGEKQSLPEFYKEKWTGTTSKWMARKAASVTGVNLPDEASKFPSFMADQTMSQISDAQLEQLKLARQMAENNYKLDILQRRTVAQAFERSKETTEPAKTQEENVARSATPEIKNAYERSKDTPETPKAPDEAVKNVERSPDGGYKPSPPPKSDPTQVVENGR